MPEGLDFETMMVIGGVGFTAILLTVLMLTAILVVRPRARLHKRMAAHGLVGGKDGGAVSKSGNPRQKRILEKLQELEDKKKQKSRRNQIRTDLLQAGIDMAVKKYLIITAIIGLVTAAFLMLLSFSPFMAGPVGLVVAFLLPKVVLSFMARSRRKNFTRHFANAIDVLVRGIRSGLPVGECLAIISRESPDPVGEEFRQLVEGQKLGVALEDILRRGLERMPTSEFKFFAIVLQIQLQTGGNLADTLANLSSVLRDRKKMADKVKSLSSEAKASSMIIGSLPFAVAGMVSIMNPDYLTPLFTTQIGNILLVVGLGWMGVGIAVMKKMVSFEI